MARTLTQTWLTKKPSDSAESLTAILGALVAILTWMFWNDIAGASSWMPASRDQVFQQHEWWRLWSSLFAHADIGHLLSNALLFIPLAYFLTGYFGPYFFPIGGLISGGIVNFFALQTMNPHTSLVGISGLVYWMGSAWLTLYLLVGSKESTRRRIGKALFIAAALFAPQTFEPNVSYVSHFLGFVIGVPSALVYYWQNRERFESARVYEDVQDEQPEFSQVFEPTPLVFRDFDQPPATDVTFH